ncbi:MAG: hypothetical protein KAW12_18285 [Candidatus Aminicenantes bacterium]|nr:hypothetical protein [Candidatus Aminicenantes bacterium]
MKYTFSFESKRLFANKKHVVFFLFFLLLSLYFVNSGVEKYKNFFIEKANFLDYEKRRIKQYINYEQYGAYGFRVLFQPSPLTLFYSSAFLYLEGAVDTKEIVNISINYKGKSIFANNAAFGFGDFSSMFFVFGSLLMLYFGLGTFRSNNFLPMDYRDPMNRAKNRMKYISTTIFTRAALLNCCFAVVCGAAYLLARLKGIRFSGAESGLFILFSLFAVLYVTFFYFLGVLGTVVFSFERSLYTVVYAIWFLLLFLTPGIHGIDLEKRAGVIKSNEAVNMIKLDNVMKFESRYKVSIEKLENEKVKNLKKIFPKFLDDYIKNEYMLNKAIEKDLSREVYKLITYNERKSVILPSSFYLFLTKELSGYGYNDYQNFLQYMLALKENFSRFFFDKRYTKIGRQVESFISGQENVFRSECALPGNFWRGFLLTLFYSLLVLGTGLSIFKRRGAAPEKKETKQRFFGTPLRGKAAGAEKEGAPHLEIDIKRMEKGKTYFSLCRDKMVRRQILDYLVSQGAAVLQQLPLCHFDPWISLKSWIEYECRGRNLPPDEVSAKLEEWGIPGSKQRLKLKTLGSETLNRAYLGIKLAEKFQIYVFDDFLKGLSKEFEKDFTKIMQEAVGDRAIVLYIGSEMFDINVKKRETPVEDDRFFIIDFKDVSLR